MADGPNTNSGSKVASALNSIPFGNIIGGPLAACVRAQAEAAQTTIDFIRGFTMTNSELDPEGVPIHNSKFLYIAYLYPSISYIKQFSLLLLSITVSIAARALIICLQSY